MEHLTTHAQSRLQQRAIKPETVECLLEFGSRSYDHHGGTIYFFDRSARARLAKRRGSGVHRELEKQMDVYVVVGKDGAVITAGHRSKRLYRH